MVGNLWEWVADWMPETTNSPGWSNAFSDDLMGFAGADALRGPGAIVRGGNWNYGAQAGPFAIDASYQPNYANNDNIGFRCAH